MRDGLGIEPVVLVARRRKWVYVLLVSCWFVARGTIAVLDDRGSGWFPAVFFGCCALSALAMILVPPRLSIDADGISATLLGRRSRYEFLECSPFVAQPLPLGIGKGVVVFDWTGSRGRPRAGRGGRVSSAGNTSLPDTFGMSADDLAALLNRRRADRVGGG